MEKDIKFEVMKKIADTNFKYQNLTKIDKIDSNSPPSVFVGSKLKYPSVNVGILSPIEKEKEAWVYDDEAYWAQNDFQIKDVIKLRDSLLNSRFQAKVSDSRTNKKFVEIAKEIAISSKPVDIELELNKNLNIGRKKDKVVVPHGMKAGLKKAKITSNVKVHQKLDHAMNDEIKAEQGILSLYKNKFSEYTLNKILSVGVLGLKKNKKLVPTRWSITATDDIIGKNLIKQIKNYKWIEDHELYFGQFMGNCYLILLIPGVWSYELFELYFPGSSWNPSSEIKASTDHELYSGRKSYASQTVGGYYAARLPILEHLNKIKKQATVVTVRIETPSYWAALGVWVVRESVRKAFKNKNLKFKSLDELIESAKKIGYIKYGFNPSGIFKKSLLLNSTKTQKNLRGWF
ncbi:hypothetical protein ISS08_01685 [Candidatus Pacearchaeota archaeon]|nr:hypothetical protein [Candidatus Pacearchaeota archaeon]